MGGLTFKKARFYTSVSAVYVLALAFLALTLELGPFRPNAPMLAHAEPIKPVAASQEVKITSGQPVKLTIPSLDLELPIDEGFFDTANNKWTLSDNHAHFAVASMMLNDYQGNTFIYGHNHWWVFGRLKLLKPGDTMQIQTNNNHTFTYTYERGEDLKPDDMSVFRYDGPPTVTLQTCVGAWDELRRMHTFKLVRVGP